MNVERRKLVRPSALLGRDFHVDAFDVGRDLRFHLLLVGEPGLDQQSYEARGLELHAAFAPVLEDVAPTFSFAFTYVTAPWDVAIASAPDARARWTRHVVEEVLPERPALPLFVAAHSWSAELVFAGLHHVEPCVGAGALGADALPSELRAGPSWRRPLALLYNRHDERLREDNAAVIDALLASEVAELSFTRSGGHALADYVQSGGLLGLITRAALAAGVEALPVVGP